MKDETIIIRCSSEMKKEIENLALISRRTTSNYIRLILEDTIKMKTKF